MNRKKNLLYIIIMWIDMCAYIPTVYSRTYVIKTLMLYFHEM